MLGLSFLTVSFPGIASESPLDQALNFVQPEISYKTNIAYIAAKIQAGVRTYGKVVLKYAIIPGIVCVPTVLWILEKRKNGRFNQQFQQLNNQVATLQTERDGLNPEIDRLNNQLREFEEERNTFNNQIRKLEVERDALNHQMREVEERAKAADSARKKLQKQLQEKTNFETEKPNQESTQQPSDPNQPVSFATNVWNVGSSMVTSLLPLSMTQEKTK